MNIQDTPISGLKVIELKIFNDNRGFFVERFQEEKFRQLELPTHFVQDNHSRSIPRVLRGLHFQSGPAQAKLVGVLRGRIWDVAVDLRPESPTFGKHHALELSDKNGRLLWIPKGFAHGFCVLGEEPADVMYKVDAPYSSKGDSGIRWNDPELAIQWPVTDPILSEKDAKLPTFGEWRKTQFVLGIKI
jgi:dTDP-4-dehydrorhamnose 3,5-epimerase